MTTTNPLEETPVEESSFPAVARVVVIGCGWWAQGWHLPHLANNVPDVEIAAIIDPSPNPVSTLSSSPLLSLTDLSKKYKCPFYTSIEELLADPEIGPTIDGAIVATSHASHFDVGMALLKEGIHRRRMAEAIAKEEEGSNKVGGNKRRKMLENIGYGDGSGTPQYPPPRQPKILHRALHILMEKPMTTSVEEARRLWEMSAKRYPQASSNPGALGGQQQIIISGAFVINHTASYRPQTQVARQIVTSNQIGQIRHISASMNGPLMWLFDDAANDSWVSKTPWTKTKLLSGGDEIAGDGKTPMSGNGYAWGQIAHVLAWIYAVLGSGTTTNDFAACDDDNTKANDDVAIPVKVYCNMTHASTTGADVSLAAVITCRDGITFSLSGTALLPGSQYTELGVGKHIRVEMFGTKGSLMYGGDDKIPESGRLELRRSEKDAKVEFPCSKEMLSEYLPSPQQNQDGGEYTPQIGAEDLKDGFYFEDGDQNGVGPGSMKVFLDSCRLSSSAFAHSMAVLEEECAASISGVPSVCGSTTGGETPASAYSMAVEKSGVSVVSGISGDGFDEEESRRMTNDSLIGLRTVQIIDAMYRSSISGNAEAVI